MVTAPVGPARPRYGNCPECLRVVSLRETTCRHCGHQYAPTRADLLLAAAFRAVLLAAALFATLWYWIAPVRLFH